MPLSTPGVAFVDHLLPTGARAHSFPRAMPVQDVSPLTSGQLYMVAVDVHETNQITSLSILWGLSATSSVTHWWLALYDANRVLLGASSDQLSASINAGVAQSLPLVNKANVSPGLYYIGVCVVAVGCPSLICSVSSTLLTGQAPKICGTSTSGLTTDPPATAGAITATANVPYAYF